MIWLVATSWASDLTESNISATSLGVKFAAAPESAKQFEADGRSSTDVDILLGQRLRWTLIDADTFKLRARVNARFILSPGDEKRTLNPEGGDAFFQRNLVRTLGLSLLTDKLTLDVGRHQVFKGGPRLVDGLQFLYHPSSVIDVGAWGGLIPDLFSSDPRINRFGGGPIIALSASRIQASVVGEVLYSNGLDRLGMLAQARVSAARTIEISGRLDLALLTPDGGPQITDAQLFARWAPIESFRVDASYNIFSSYRYQRTANLDPDIRRFDARVQNTTGRLPVVTQDCLDPSTAQVASASVNYHPRTEGIAPQLGLQGRYRFGEDVVQPTINDQPKCVFDDTNNFIRVHPSAGITGLPIGGHLDVTVDGNYYSIEGHTQYDAGISVYFEPTDTGIFSVDASYRALINPYDQDKNPYGYIDAEGGTPLGHYGDLFVDVVVTPLDLSVGVGLNGVVEPNDVAGDVSLAGFARLTKYLRSRRKKDK